MRRSICSRTIVAFLSHVLVSLLVVLCAQVEAQNLVVSGATFLDGDTFVYNRASKVRLAGIDTPEIGHDGAPDQYYAEASRKIAAEIAGKATLVLVPVGAGKDRHGRGLCDVRLPDGRSLNEVLVEKGAAYVYYHDDVPQALQARLLAAQRPAMDAQGSISATGTVTGSFRRGAPRGVGSPVVTGCTFPLRKMLSGLAFLRQGLAISGRLCVM